jgi:hypothetical protein
MDDMLMKGEGKAGRPQKQGKKILESSNQQRDENTKA